MEIGNLGVGFRPQIAINSTRKWRCKQFLGQKMQNKKNFLLVCSVASKVCSFSEEENGLIEALIGIQGRGRAASPQQLQVSSHFLVISKLNFLFCMIICSCCALLWLMLLGIRIRIVGSDMSRYPYVLFY